MNTTEKLYPALLDAAGEGTLVLTVNKRLSRHLRDLFDRRMINQGKTAWRTPEIHSVDAWLKRALAMVGEEWRLLKRFPAQRAWEEIIEADAAASDLGLLQVSATARQAMEAHNLLVEYGAEIEGMPLTEDHAVFLRWRRKFLEICRAGDWLDSSALTMHVCQAIRRGDVPIPGRAFLVGFDEMTPRLKNLKSAFSETGCTLEEFQPVCAPHGELLRLPCGDAKDEVRRAARWIRSLLEAGEEKIGIVVPELKRYRPLIERIFREEIDPASQVGPTGEEARFSLSLGSKLVEQGMVTAAFEILGAGPMVPLDLAGFLLRTPYLKGSLGESASRAQLDKALRSFRAKEISLSRLKELAREEGSGLNTGKTPRMAEVLAALEKGLASGKKCFPGEWTGRFACILAEAGWPGERPLNSLEYQIYQAWKEKLLPAFVSLDMVSAPLERGAALSLLRRLASEIVFQPEGPKGPVQVMGILEAAGLSFNHLWVMGLTENSLPAPPRPNPFLPVRLQAAQGMPHSNAERELIFAQKAARRLFAAAPAVILSHPCREGDCELRPSPLIGGIAQAEVPTAPANDPVTTLRRRQLVMEELVDQQGPPFSGAEKASGGTSILKDQALCPFRAFAHHRLAAKALECVEIGLDAGTRGTLLHASLEYFWRRIRSHQALCTLAEGELQQRVEDCVESAITAHFGKKSFKPPEILLKIEQKRLAELVLEWVDGIERTRPSFTVEELEKTHRETFGGLVIDTKVDRIDRLADGSRAILDYKTGRPDLADLLDERLLEPQLPVYGVGDGGVSLASVAFAMVRRGECSFKGVAREKGMLPRVEGFSGSKEAVSHGIADWEELLEQWRGQLEELGREFVHGAAAVDPVDPKKACDYCDLACFCRIHEIREIREEDE